MIAYYNEHDAYAAHWLRNLIAAGHIAPGVVDERDIRDVRPEELADFTQCHFFAGIGVWSHALRRAGWSDDRKIWTGSCPCQPFSAAGRAGGFADERHLWPYWQYLIAQCRPPVVGGEQVASKDGLGWLDLVSADMEGAGYAFGASDLCAAGFSGAHIRQRLYFVGLAHGSLPRLEGSDAQSMGIECPTPQRDSSGQPAGLDDTSSTHAPMLGRNPADWLFCRDGKWRPVEPSTFPLAHAAPARVGRLRAYGNALDGETVTGFLKAVIELI